MGNCVRQASRHDDGGEPVWAAERGDSSNWASWEERKKESVKVTIRISKSQLQKLMASGAGGGGGGGMTVGKVLAEIVNAGEVVDGRHHGRRWEPALGSIPEAVES